MTSIATPELHAAAAAAAVRDGFEEELAGVAGVRNAAEARLVGLVVRAVAEGLWEGHRIHTPVQWLMWRAGVARSDGGAGGGPGEAGPGAAGHDAEVRRGPVVVNLGRTKHIVPRRIRRLIEHRDRGCRVPGCDQSWWLQVHHIVHWEDDGVTDTHNLLCLCSRHHRLHHEGLLGITGNADDPNGVVFTDAAGHRMAGATRARPPKACDMPTVAAYQGPTGERLDRDAVFFTPTRPTAADPADGADDDDTGDADESPPARRRRARCHTNARTTGDGPTTPRGPPAT